MKKTTSLITFSATVLLASILAGVWTPLVEAQITGPGAIPAGGTKAGITNPAIGTFGDSPDNAKSGSIFVTYFIRMWQTLITAGGISVIFFFIWGALRWIMAGGDSGKIQKARDQMVQAAIGLILLVTSFVIIGFISQLLFGENFDILNLKLP